jgi:hypothetical protein
VTRLCHLRGPTPGPGEKIEITYWPEVADEDRCSLGDTEISPVPCRVCAFFYQPGGKPLQPHYRYGLSGEWWDQSGLCIHAGPAPMTRESRKVYWPVVSMLNGRCRDGKDATAKEDSQSTVVALAV